MHWLDPHYLPEMSGTVTKFLINPHGDIDGMILKNGTEVHFPPHLSHKIAKAVGLGEKIKVRGVKPRDADVIAGVSLETAKGAVIVDEGPDQEHKRPKRKHQAPAARKSAASGVVQRALHGPKGEIRGVLLDSGEAVRFPKHEAEKFASFTKPGAKFAARGPVIVTKLGSVMDADEIGSSPKTLRRIGPKHKHAD